MDLIRALGELAEAPGPEQVRTARMLELPGEPTRNEYSDLFVVQLYPYASVYLSPDGQVGGPVQEHIAGFWRVLRQPLPRDPDHIVTLFSTYSELSERSRSATPDFLQELAQQMRHAFLWEHIISWLLPYATRVRELGSPTYRGWATLVLDALEAEAAQVGPPSDLPLHLRSAPPLDPAAEPSGLADALFAPVRSGFVLARADLSRCARDLEIKMRVAERRYTLRTLLAQDTARVAGWLSVESERQAELMRSSHAVFEKITEWWAERAMTTARVLAMVSTHARGREIST